MRVPTEIFPDPFYKERNEAGEEYKELMRSSFKALYSDLQRVLTESPSELTPEFRAQVMTWRNMVEASAEKWEAFVLKVATDETYAEAINQSWPGRR